MHRVLMLLLVLGAFAGLGERVLAQVGAHAVDVVVAGDCCSDDHDHPSDDQDHHGPDCPPGPHHHHSGLCCGGLLVMEEPEGCRLNVAPGLRTAWGHPDDAIPEGPVLSMDKPPLI